MGERQRDAEAYYAQAMRRVEVTPPPSGQKYAPGQRVKIADDLGPTMSHFPKGVFGTVHHTYAHAYGGDGHALSSYCIAVDGRGLVSWYDEDQLSPADEFYGQEGREVTQ